MATRIYCWCAFLGLTLIGRAAVNDRPFLQDAAVRVQLSSELTNATFQKLCLDKNNVPYVLTDKGVARVFGDMLALDRSFRPLAGKRALDIALSPQGELYYLFDDRWLSNEQSGQPLGHFQSGAFTRLAVAADGAVCLSGPSGLAWTRGDKVVRVEFQSSSAPAELFGSPKALFAAADGKLFRIGTDGKAAVLSSKAATTAGWRDQELLVGTHNGYFGVNPETGEITTPLEFKLPATDITRIVPVREGTWFGTTRGVFFIRTHTSQGPQLPDGPNGVRYYVSQRWLKDDSVVDLAVDHEGNLWVLTKTGLNKIELLPMTLAEKAAYFDRKVRLRHIRFGLTAERRLPNAGDIATSEMIDTDNDGGWSSYYLASQACRFAVTGSEEARSNAWEVFGALERLQTINPIPGFPARTFERAGFKVSDPDRWRAVPGGDWEWKGHTSSDEIASQSFAYAMLWECVAKTDAERARIATNYTRIADHILGHNLYLVDVDGKPTLWGRWNPEYVNWFPHTIFDRRLNSAEITATLELAYRLSGRESYREKAYELFDQHGYLTNILSSMKLLKATPGFVHLGEQLGDEWNHSDDELAFVTYWVLYRFGFTEELQTQFAKAIREHWEIERAEQYPMWNFIYAGSGAGNNCDPEGAVWTLRGFPLDTISWRVENAYRKDVTKLPANFMGRELKELLPPGERQIARCNTQPFILDGGDGGHTEFPGDEFLLGYWLGRYLKLIE